jgi:hypothetical protein
MHILQIKKTKMLLLFLLLINSLWCITDKVHILEDLSHTCSNPNYANIGAALAAASDYQTIVLCCGIHPYGTDIEITKPIKILGDPSCTEKPMIRFTNRCANLNIKANNVTVHNIKFRKNEPWWGPCAPSSQAAITCRHTCRHIYTTLGIKHCIFDTGFHEHIFIRSKGSVYIEENVFKKALVDSIRIAHLEPFSPLDEILSIQNNSFIGWEKNAINFQRISSCRSDKVTNMVMKINNNYASANEMGKHGENFFRYNIWNPTGGAPGRRDPPQPYSNDLEVRGNTVIRAQKFSFVLENPKHFDRTFSVLGLLPGLRFLRNMGQRSKAGIVCNFIPPFPSHGVPPDGKVLVVENEFCLMTGITGTFLTPSEYDIGFRPHPTATLAMFNAIDNTICTGCETMEFPEGCMHGTCNCYTPRRNGEMVCECICDEGWEGECCQTPLGEDFTCCGILSTNATVCGGHGVCEEPDVCICLGGYYGDCCEFNPCYDECGEAGCGENGDCWPQIPRRTVPYECVCHTGFGGDCCIGCGEHCPEGCQNGVGCELRGRRNGDIWGCGECPEGWEGPCCDVPVCTNDCCGHGTCIAPGTCDCDTGWKQPDCCISWCCGGDGCNEPEGGNCFENAPGQWGCQCLPGYVDPCCEPAQPSCGECDGPCQNGGICVEDGGSGRRNGQPYCDCTGTGYEGVCCHIPLPCDEECPEGCGDHGHCEFNSTQVSM